MYTKTGEILHLQSLSYNYTCHAVRPLYMADSMLPNFTLHEMIFFFFGLPFADD